MTPVLPPAPPAVPRQSGTRNVLYVVCAMIMTLIGVVAILLILMLRPRENNTQLIATVVGMLAPTTGVIIALIKIDEVHTVVNSRLDELLAARETAARVVGREEGLQTVLAAPALAAPLGGSGEAVSPPVPVPVQIVQPSDQPIPVMIPAADPGEGRKP